jgi:hypothetical protein
MMARLRAHPDGRIGAGPDADRVPQQWSWTSGAVRPGLLKTKLSERMRATIQRVRMFSAVGSAESAAVRMALVSAA